MGTLIKFRQKQFGKGEEVVRFIKTPGGIISLSALGVSSANLATNASRHKSDKKYQTKQIESMDKLSKSISKLDKDLDKKSDTPKLVSFKLKSK